MLSKSQAIQLGEVATDFLQCITKLEAKFLPSTSLEVLEERWKAISDNVLKIHEAEELYAKSYAQVFHSWGALMDDEELEQVT